ncbi:hypothetical protein Gotur_004978 [Gossypium turneri]
MNGEMIQTKVKELLQKMYGDANSEFNFSIGWLERFKTRHGIKSYRRFGESGSIIMENIEYALPQIRAKLKIFYWKDIYNMDETGLFYRLQAYHSLARKQLEGRKKDKERLTIMVCYNRDDFVRWFDARMTGRKVLLTVDNCPSYPKLGTLRERRNNVLHAIHFINVAWNIDVKPTTIANCFRHYKI